MDWAKFDTWSWHPWLFYAAALWIGLSLILGLGILGYFMQQTAVKYRAYERVVTVKGLSEREYPADTVIWPIQFTLASNDMGAMFDEIDQQTRLILDFLSAKGLPETSYADFWCMEEKGSCGVIC